MIVILCQLGTKEAGARLGQVLGAALSLSAPPLVLTGDQEAPAEFEWDDLLLVLFDRPDFNEQELRFLNTYQAPRQADGREGAIIPVALDPNRTKPPEPISLLKAVVYDDRPESREQIVKSVEVFLGLALRPGEYQVFVSHRASDGGAIARELCERLEVAGFKPWLDEAKENLLPGHDVQKEIHKQLEKAGILLILDTPAAPASDWIKEEIDVANSNLIPIIPVLVGTRGAAARFGTLRALERSAVVKPQGIDHQPLSEAEWQTIHSQLTEVLLAAYRRRLRIVPRLQRSFEKEQFAWRVRDERRRLYETERNRRPNLRTAVFAHCSIHDIKYYPALIAYQRIIAQLPQTPAFNYRLCVYDSEAPLSEPEMNELRGQVQNLDDMILAHSSEIPMLLVSNFTRLRDV